VLENRSLGWSVTLHDNRKRALIADPSLDHSIPKSNRINAVGRARPDHCRQARACELEGAAADLIRGPLNDSQVMTLLIDTVVLMRRNNGV